MVNGDGPEKPAPSAEAISSFKFVQSLERGLAVIESFGHDRPRQSLSDVARLTGLDRAAARRFLLTLRALGYVGSDGKLFWLQPKTLDLGYRYLSSLPWWREAQRAAEDLAMALGSPCAVAVRDRDQAVYVAYASAARFADLARSSGTRLPAYASALGRILLAFLDEGESPELLARTEMVRLTHRTVTDLSRLREILAGIRQDGYALVDQELEIGLRSLAVPIADRGGQVVAAISASPQDMRVPPDEILATSLGALRQAAARIAAFLPS
jgi:IclR family pca regulon transcriptional regulator